MCREPLNPDFTILLWCRENKCLFLDCLTVLSCQVLHDDGVLTLYRNGSCEITQEHPETFSEVDSVSFASQKRFQKFLDQKAVPVPAGVQQMIVQV